MAAAIQIPIRTAPVEPLTRGPEGLIPARLRIVPRAGENDAPGRGLPVPGAHAWPEGQLATLSHPRCALCRATGQVTGVKGLRRPCACVYRRIFRSCLSAYRASTARSGVWQARYTGMIDAKGRTTAGFSMPQQEYAADFELIARRALTHLEHRVFSLHLLHGLEWPDCRGRLPVNRGKFFHTVYAVERTLGWAFAETKPHALFPAGEYFRARGGRQMQVMGEANPWPWEAL